MASLLESLYPSGHPQMDIRLVPEGIRRINQKRREHRAPSCPHPPPPHAPFITGEGHEVWGIDSTPLAIEKAREKAAQRGLKVHFLVLDALHLTSPPATA